ncbi:MAG: flagellar basal-body rod protein FlgF [Dissulfurimicrobium sp.]|uniref:flagellar basal-body rod protein FlgF n=1 Tax=Dissulfurimicrobium sp. TaxID=2022436 RepID=UPI004049DA39
MSLIMGLHPHSRLGYIEAIEGANILERKLQLTSNNIANASTIGFKKQSMTFEEYLLLQVDSTKRTAKGEVVWSDMSLGVMKQTNNPFDFALEGDGFFVVQTPEGVRYTRAGNFTLDSQKQLVTQQGYPVLGGGASIILDDTTGKGVWLSKDGRFWVDESEVGQLDVVNFENPQALERMGGNLYAATLGSGQATPVDTPIKQGFIEGSNVNPVEEMVNLIDIYRAYEVQQKTMKTIDQMDAHAANDIGKVG